MAATGLVDWFGKHFDETERQETCLHEAAHIVYARRAGFEPSFHGPNIYYHEPTGQFWSCVTSLTFPDDLYNADPMVVAKALLSPC